MRDFIIWLLSYIFKPFTIIAELLRFTSEAKVNKNILTQPTSKFVIDEDLKLDIEKYLLKRYLLSRCLVLLINAIIVIPITAAVTKSAALTSLATALVYFATSSISEDLVSELYEV